MSEPTICGVVVARSASRRLSGKAMAVVDGRPLIGYVFERARRVSGFDSLLLATSDQPSDDRLAGYATGEGVSVFRGDEENAALRVVSAATAEGCSHFCRLNGDSPWLSPELIHEGIAALRADPTAHLITNLIGRRFPMGISLELVKTDALARLIGSLDAHEREHVTACLYRHRDELHLREIVPKDPSLATARLVVDDEADLEVFRTMVKRFGDDALSVSWQEAARSRLSLEGAKS